MKRRFGARTTEPRLGVRACSAAAGLAFAYALTAPCANAENPLVPPRDLVTYRLAAKDTGFSDPDGVVGRSRAYAIAKEETFLDIARRESLGYNELIAANPGVDPWMPAEGSRILLPSEWILPPGPREGLVVNIPEMRLYHYLPARGGDSSDTLVVSYPVGLGRDEWRTPLAEFRVRGKTTNPVWILPETVKAERIAEQGFAEYSIPGGHPDNPLGRHRIELTLGAYAIHGTNKNWGIGMQVSHGCIRLYPEDIAALFPLVETGTKGRFEYKPVKIGVRDGRILAEVHEDIYGLTPWLWSAAVEAVTEAGVDARVDFAKLRAVVDAATGVPSDVGPAFWPLAGHAAYASPASGKDDSGAIILDARAESEHRKVP